MPQTRQQKEELLVKLIEKFTKAKSVIFSNYRGLSVKDMFTLRRKLREKGIEYNVSKKTLFKIAASKAGLPELPKEIISGPCAAAFSYEDEIAAARILKDYSKENDKLKLLGGLFFGKVLSLAETKFLASLPSYEELIVKFMRCMKGPVSGFHAVLHGVMRKFVGTVQALHDQKAKS